MAYEATEDTNRLAAPLIAAFTTACAAAAIYSHFRGMGTSFFEFLRVWWFSDGLGLLILTPLVLSLWPPVPGGIKERARLHGYSRSSFSGSARLQSR